ncbi:MAG: hypothetical protein AAFZ87_07065, partial [Planctomycetota bacterium]
ARLATALQAPRSASSVGGERSNVRSFNVPIWTGYVRHVSSMLPTLAEARDRAVRAESRLNSLYRDVELAVTVRGSKRDGLFRAHVSISTTPSSGMSEALRDAIVREIPSAFAAVDLIVITD